MEEAKAQNWAVEPQERNAGFEVITALPMKAIVTLRSPIA
jgi:hypothetical protein